MNDPRRTIYVERYAIHKYPDRIFVYDTNASEEASLDVRHWPMVLQVLNYQAPLSRLHNLMFRTLKEQGN